MYVTLINITATDISFHLDTYLEYIVLFPATLLDFVAIFQGPAPQQRVQAKSAQDIERETAPVPAVTKIRVTVTATNGITDARINEIRLYDAEGVAPFPKQV